MDQINTDRIYEYKIDASKIKFADFCKEIRSVLKPGQNIASAKTVRVDGKNYHVIVLSHEEDIYCRGLVVGKLITAIGIIGSVIVKHITHAECSAENLLLCRRSMSNSIHHHDLRLAIVD